VLQEVSIDEMYEDLSTSESAVTSEQAAELVVGRVKTKGTVSERAHGMSTLFTLQWAARTHGGDA
jgi:hypothetical protein